MFANGSLRALVALVEVRRKCFQHVIFLNMLPTDCCALVVPKVRYLEAAAPKSFHLPD